MWDNTLKSSWLTVIPMLNRLTWFWSVLHLSMQPSENHGSGTSIYVCRPMFHDNTFGANMASIGNSKSQFAELCINSSGWWVQVGLTFWGALMTPMLYPNWKEPNTAVNTERARVPVTVCRAHTRTQHLTVTMMQLCGCSQRDCVKDVEKMDHLERYGLLHRQCHVHTQTMSCLYTDNDETASRLFTSLYILGTLLSE